MKMKSYNPIIALKEQGIDSLKKLKDPQLILKAQLFLKELAKEDGTKPLKKVPSLTKEKILTLFVNSLLNFRKSTIIQYKKEIIKLLDYLEANKINIANIKIEHIEGYIALQIKLRKIKPGSQAKLTYIVRVFLNFLKERGYNDIDPEKLEAPRRNSGGAKREYVTEENFIQLMDCLGNRVEKFKNENLTYKVIVCLLYCTGIRRSELIKLKWDNIYFDQNKIKILDGKGGKDRKIKISDDLKELLHRYRKVLGKYKCVIIRGLQGRKKITRTQLQNIIKGLFKEAKISRPGLTIHSFRHSYVTNVCRKAGLNFYGLTPIGFTASGIACPLSVGRLHLQAYACSISGGVKIAQESAGHSRIDVTESYLHTTEEDMDKAIIEIPQQKPSSDENN